MKRSAALLLSAAMLSALPAEAQRWGNSYSPGQARDEVQRGNNVPLNRIYRDLQQRYGGRSLGAELFSRQGGGSDYHITWLTGDGRRMLVVVDAQTGRIRRTSGD